MDGNVYWGYPFGDILNGKVKSVNIYIIYGIKCLNKIISYFLCIQISYVTQNMLFKKCCSFLFLNLKPRTGE